MPTYEYECPNGHLIEGPLRADNVTCPVHSETAQRRWFVNRSKGFGEHFNFALGQYVKSDRDFDEKLKIAGEEHGAVYTRIDPGDAARPSDGDEIYDTQMRTLTEKGFVGSDGKVTIDDGGHFVPK